MNISLFTHSTLKLYIRSLYKCYWFHVTCCIFWSSVIKPVLPLGFSDEEVSYAPSRIKNKGAYEPSCAI